MPKVVYPKPPPAASKPAKTADPDEDDDDDESVHQKKPRKREQYSTDEGGKRLKIGETTDEETHSEHSVVEGVTGESGSEVQAVETFDEDEEEEYIPSKKKKALRKPGLKEGDKPQKKKRVGCTRIKQKAHMSTGGKLPQEF